MNELLQFLWLPYLAGWVVVTWKFTLRSIDHRVIAANAFAAKWHKKIDEVTWMRMHSRGSDYYDIPKKAIEEAVTFPDRLDRFLILFNRAVVSTFWPVWLPFWWLTGSRFMLSQTEKRQAAEAETKRLRELIDEYQIKGGEQL